jgi:hypothetical protein
MKRTTSETKLLARELNCRGDLTVHKDRSVTCSNSACTMTRSAENALATHSFIVVCRQPICDRCATAYR